MKSSAASHTEKLKDLAIRHGFEGVGISRAEFMEDEATKLENWLSKGYHGEMTYMANHFDKRVDPRKLVPGAKSVVSLMYNYYPGESSSEISNRRDNKGDLWKERMPDAGRLTPDTKQKEWTNFDTSSNGIESFKISKYAYGEDYHKVIRRKLKELIAELKTEVGDFHGRVFVDSAPVMERDWAKRSGQGWVGKNTLLIHPKKGSYFFLAEMILDIEFEYDHPMRDHCGTCTKCIEACPTDAISPEGYILDGSKCISYLTIELRSNIPDEFRGKMEDWIFGCDICQEVCPWNRFSKSHHEPAFMPDENLKNMKKENWIEMTEEIFDNLFDKSPLQRTGFKGMKRNIQFASRGE